VPEIGRDALRLVEPGMERQIVGDVAAPFFPRRRWRGGTDVPLAPPSKLGCENIDVGETRSVLERDGPVGEVEDEGAEGTVVDLPARVTIFEIFVGETFDATAASSRSSPSSSSPRMAVTPAAFSAAARSALRARSRARTSSLNSAGQSSRVFDVLPSSASRSINSGAARSARSSQPQARSTAASISAWSAQAGNIGRILAAGMKAVVCLGQPLSPINHQGPCEGQ
jgi:hypothetical protein